MAKGKWGRALVLGALGMLALWTLAQLLLAALAVKGVLAEDGLAMGQDAAALLCGLLGGGYAARRSGLGKLTAAMGTAAVFLGCCGMLGFLIFGDLAVTGEGLRMLAALLGGALAAGLLSSQGKRGRGGKRLRRKGKG